MSNYMEGFNPKEYFNGKCPYTDKPCAAFKCETCPTEAEERAFAESVDDEFEKALGGKDVIIPKSV